MTIPEAQLATWTNQGATTTSKATHESIRTALSTQGSPVAPMLSSGRAEIYLQGSYKNSTNIRGDSDVDLVVQYNSTFGYDLAALPLEQRQAHEQSYPTNATYLWADFRRDVLSALRSYYAPGTVSEGNKCLKLAGGSGRLAADIVPAIRYKKYTYHRSPQNEGYVEGIRFEDRAGRTIVNYPKKHFDNGRTKNAAERTGGRYKPSVRMFKNARTYLANARAISGDLAPSYFLECLLYNVPDIAYSTSCQETYQTALRWLGSPQNLAGCVCQNEQRPLFGDTPEQWSMESAAALIVAFANLWDSWR